MEIMTIRELHEHYCNWMANIDAVREQLSNSFKVLNHIDDKSWDMLIEYSYQMGRDVRED